MLVSPAAWLAWSMALLLGSAYAAARWWSDVEVRQ